MLVYVAICARDHARNARCYVSWSMMQLYLVCCSLECAGFSSCIFMPDGLKRKKSLAKSAATDGTWKFCAVSEIENSRAKIVLPTMNGLPFLSTMENFLLSQTCVSIKLGPLERVRLWWLYNVSVAWLSVINLMMGVHRRPSKKKLQLIIWNWSEKKFSWTHPKSWRNVCWTSENFWCNQNPNPNSKTFIFETSSNNRNQIPFTSAGSPKLPGNTGNLRVNLSTVDCDLLLQRFHFLFRISVYSLREFTSATRKRNWREYFSWIRFLPSKLFMERISTGIR